ncbi:protein kinase domain-containing protein [Gemmatimonas phototrophica]|uniref:protein kinase domain-containing protein n=1 Tax=Gemmatimonas phototrophica TaxID=1379270 RepID=UPI0006A7089E|nr:protein kinase [Gemmatimonas phototrophica]
MTPFDRLTTALADRYRVTRELGAGGMATVYLAHDLKHERDVAIKVLHPDLGAALGGERFLTEIRTTARLQHPHILPLLDSGAADGLLYYVMPLVTGETLRARLERERQLPIADAVRIAREVASALDYAHRQNVIHRDIKPENILLHDGSALVADFGIALAVQSAGGQRMTQTGLSLGTPQYMSPEQAMGERTIDARSDIYALGAVTYEMLAGDAPFMGSSVQAIVAKVLSEKPTSLHTLRDTVPEHIEVAVLTALAKLPADRFASAAEFAAALGASTSTITVSGARRAAPPSRAARVARIAPWALAVGFAAALAVVYARQSGTGVSNNAPSRQQVTLWQYQMPSPLDAGATRLGNEAAIAPDGSAIVFTDSTPAGRILMRKARDATDASPIPGTEGGIAPFYSPDGKWIAFLTLKGQLRKVPAAGGGAVTIVESNIASAFGGSAWLDDGSIVYNMGRDLKRISADGATMPSLNIAASGTSAGGQNDVVSIDALPGARGFLFTVCRSACAVGSDTWVYDMKGDSARPLLPRALGAWYSPTGHVLYTSRDNGLYAVPFDVATLTVTGGAFAVIDGVLPTKFALSPSGAALYTIDRTTASASGLVWVSRDGRAEPVDSSWRARFDYPAVSPDGRAIAVSVRDKTTDLWMWRSNGTRTKVQSSAPTNWRPSWSGDGQSLAFVTVRDVNATDSLAATPAMARADGTGGTTPLVGGRVNYFEVELSRDGQWMVLRSDEAGTSAARLSRLYARRRTGDTTLRLVPTGDVSALQPALSPDGRWLAYGSGAVVGSREIVVQSFPDAQQRVVVSVAGGSEPRWSGNGRELFYTLGGQMMAVSVPPGPVFTPGPPRALFSVAGYVSARNRAQYDVSPDGQRFLMIRRGSASQVVYVENWFAELLAKAKQ